MAYAIPASLVSQTVFQSRYINTIIANLNALSVHDHSGSLGEGNTQVLAGSAASAIGGSLVYREECRGGPDRVTSCACVYSGGNTFPISPATCILCGVEWGFFNLAGSLNAAGMGVITEHYITPGTYKLDLYYIAAPSCGVLTIYTGPSLIVGEVDTYAAASVVKKFSGSFSNSGSLASNPAHIYWLLSSSKNGSATACLLKLGPFSMRFVGT